MAEPKKKLSKTRTHTRRSKYSVGSYSPTLCTNCGESILPHTVCKHCGFYRGKATRLVGQKEILAPEAKD